MPFSKTHMQFFTVLNRLRGLNWDRMLRELRPPELMALSVVSQYHEKHPERPGIYVSAIADEVNCPLPAVSKLLRNLEQKELLRRAVDPENRRNTFVILTDKGRETLARENERCAAVGDNIFAQMSEEEITTLLNNVNHIVDLLARELERQPGEPDDK